jgi:hypothetical protein
MDQLDAVAAPNTVATPRFCVDCEHIDQSGYHRAIPKCNAPGARETDLVKGFYRPTCEYARDDGKCGYKARLFELRVTVDVTANPIPQPRGTAVATK